MDLTQSYHQIKLTEQASDYTFMVSCGEGARRYKWTRAPQGLKVSGDWFNVESDRAFQDIPGCSKLVDDLFIQANSYNKFKERIQLVLQRAREHGVTVSRRKKQSDME